jgi:hypothetical protein
MYTLQRINLSVFAKIRIQNYLINLKISNVTLSLQQAIETHRVVRRRGYHIF